MSDLLIMIFALIALSILVALVLEHKDIQIRSLKLQNKRLDEIATYWHTHTFRIERELAELKEKQRILDEEDYVYEITENDYNEFKTLKEENKKLKKQLADKHLDFEIEYNRKTEEKEHRVYLEQKLEKIKSFCNLDILNQGYATKTIDDILQIIESEEV